MHRSISYCIGAVLVTLCSAHATTFTFSTDPFAGTPVLHVPGRQIVGGELFINFSPSRDIFSFDTTVYGVSGDLNFVNSTAALLPASANAVVLETFDNDNDPLSPFGAGQAADLIADHVTTHGPGFFVYFNQDLNIPRLVFSEDLASHDADLRILARMINLNGQLGRNTLPSFAAGNFQFFSDAPQSGVPEPSGSLLAAIAGTIAACWYGTRRRTSL